MATALEVEVFPGWTLSTPLWVASAYLSDSEESIRQWESLRPSAITLKTTAEVGRKRESGTEKFNVPFLVHRDVFSRKERGQTSQSLYCDGPPRDEFLSNAETKRLLAAAKSLLPETRVGISVMMGEDYKAAARELAGADFAELNFKYAARLRANEDPGSYFAAHAKRFEAALDHLRVFADAFPRLPLFVKLTREIPWLQRCDECQRFIQAIRGLTLEPRWA